LKVKKDSEKITLMKRKALECSDETETSVLPEKITSMV
jgi:hypothetical protein